MTTTYYPPDPDKTLEEPGELSDLNNSYGATQQLAQAVAQILGNVGSSPATAMDEVRRYLAASQAGIFGFWAPPGLDPTGNSDSDGAINSAIQSTPAGGVTTIPPSNPGAHYSIISPIVGKSSVTLKGAKERATGSLSGTMQGTVIAPVTGFSQGSAQTNSSVSIPAGTNGFSVANLMIDGSAVTGAVSPPDGIASFNNAQGVMISGVVMYKVNNGINQIWTTQRCDGWNIKHTLIQNPLQVGVIITGSDLAALNVHAQNAGSDCWQVSGYHGQYRGCRGDVSAAGYGFVVNVPIGTNPLDSNEFNGGGTQFNDLGAILVTTVAGGVTRSGKSDPVKFDGMTLDGDGLSVAGANGGFHIVGPQCVTIDSCNVQIASSNPNYALITDLDGNSSPPDMISVGGPSLWSGSTGPVLDNASVGPNLIIGPEVVYTNGSGLTSYVRRCSTATLSGGTFSVTNAWANTNSRIMLSRITAGGTIGELTVARSAGSFTINSTSSSDTSLVAWMFI